MQLLITLKWDTYMTHIRNMVHAKYKWGWTAYGWLQKLIYSLFVKFEFYKDKGALMDVC